MREIISTQGDVILVDDADFGWLSTYAWSVAKVPGRPFYARTTIKGVNGKKSTKSMHRLLANPGPAFVVDHIDHNTLNNQRENLRICTVQENNMAARRRDRALPKGVSFSRRTGKYIATINVKYRKIYLGLHASKEEAAHAYNKAAVAHFGQFAVLNPY